MSQGRILEVAEDYTPVYTLGSYSRNIIKNGQVVQNFMFWRNYGTNYHGLHLVYNTNPNVELKLKMEN